MKNNHFSIIHIDRAFRFNTKFSINLYGTKL